MTENMETITALEKKHADLMEIQVEVQASMMEMNHDMHELRNIRADTSTHSVNNQRKEEDLKQVTWIGRGG